jgi:thioesterase domain-containing protein
MAEGYLREINLLQPNGPYFLGGFSAGALIAFEMAQQLRKQAQEIGLLILLDPSEPGNLDLKVHSKSTDTSSRAKHVAITSFMLRRWADLRYPKFKEKLFYVLARFKDRVGKAQIAFYFRIGRRLPSYVRQIYALNVLYQIQKEYRPQIYPGHVVLFKTKRSSPDCHGIWGKLAADGLQVHEITGEHLEIFDEPYLQSWVNQFVSYLDHASHTQGDQNQPHDRFSMTS